MNNYNNDNKEENYIPHFDPIHKHNSFAEEEESPEEAILELQQASLEQIIAPLLLPSTTTHAHHLLHDLTTPYGKAFSFLLLYDTRCRDYFFKSSADFQLHAEEIVERFVVTLLFYSTGGKEGTAGIVRFSSSNSTNNDSNKQQDTQLLQGGGWYHGSLHFLSSLHTCHWNKKLKGGNIGFGLLDKMGEYLKAGENEQEDDFVGIVKCDDDRRITHINLADNNLFGTIPLEIKYLSKLQSLDVRNNRLSGPIPHTLGDLTELKFASLDGNKLTGSIPESLSRLDQLESLYVNFNDISGTVPDSICSLRNNNDHQKKKGDGSSSNDKSGVSLSGSAGGGVLQDLWADCGRWPVVCKCCTVCCDVLSECNEVNMDDDDDDADDIQNEGADGNMSDDNDDDDSDEGGNTDAVDDDVDSKDR